MANQVFLSGFSFKKKKLIIAEIMGAKAIIISVFATLVFSIEITKKISKKIYILFTSGSTGEPKGVICDLNNIVNTVIWSKRYLNW